MKNKAVFIIGCDSGFGRLFAIKCAKSGILTFAGCLTEEGTKNLEDETQHLPGKLYTVLLDVQRMNPSKMLIILS
uniref:SDR family NAD(P)-dependent oxidoreductase n=1 Tax=Acrobeloides nanus TaxID=290746 RepID=A0A914DZI4_9BILA